MQPNFVTYEGIDGSGKSTQGKLLYNYLLDNHVPVDLSKEPTDEPIGSLIRGILSGAKKVSNESLEVLFKLDRIEHEIRIKLLNSRGIVCISDRSIISGIVYDTGTKTIDQLCQELPEINKIPDTTIFIDTPVSVALARIDLRNEELGTESDIYETKEQLERIRERFLRVMRFLENEKYSNVIIINGDNSQEEIFQATKKALEI